MPFQPRRRYCRHPVSVSAKQRPRRRRRRCRCRLTRRRYFAVAIPALLPPLLPPHCRHRQEKPAPLPTLLPPPFPLPPFGRRRSILIFPFRRRHSSLAAAIVATATLSTPRKDRAASIAVAVAAAFTAAAVAPSSFHPHRVSAAAAKRSLCRRCCCCRRLACCRRFDVAIPPSLPPLLPPRRCRHQAKPALLLSLLLLLLPTPCLSPPFCRRRSTLIAPPLQLLPSKACSVKIKNNHPINYAVHHQKYFRRISAPIHPTNCGSPWIQKKFRGTLTAQLKRRVGSLQPCRWSPRPPVPHCITPHI